MEFIKLDTSNEKELSNQVYEIIKEAGRYLLENYSLEHWAVPYSLINIQNDIMNKIVYLVKDNGSYIATFTLSNKSDYFEDSDVSIYISKFATRPQFMGFGYGSKCLNFIRKLSISLSKKYIRCEVYEKSIKSVNFYTNREFQIVGKKATRRFMVDLLEYQIQPRVMIIGAGFLQKFLIEKVNELGYESVAVDGSSNAPGLKIAKHYKVIDIKNKEECLEYAKKMQIDAVLTGATDYSVLSVSYVAEKLGLNGVNYKIAKMIKNKFQVQEKLYNSGINTHKYYSINHVTELNKLRSNIEFPVFVKPSDGSGSRGVNKANNFDELCMMVDIAIQQSISNACTIEPFYQGVEYGVECFVYKGTIYVLVIMKKEMTSPPFYAELAHNVIIDDCLTNRINENVKAIIKALEIDFGSVNMDFIDTGTKIQLVDIGIRMGGNLIGSHIIPFSSGVDYMKTMIEAALNKKICLDKKYNKYISSRLITLKTGVVENVNNERLKNIECLYKLINVGNGSFVHSYRNNLDGCGYVICEGTSFEDSKMKSNHALMEIMECISVKEMK